ncbi:MAG: thioredoxin family protein [Desulfobacterales bacterium]|jgi:thiol:disulfide interchange protein DsbD
MKFKTTGFVILFSFFSMLFFINGSASTTGIQWHSYDDGMARSKFEKKKVFIHFTADWCYYCGVMEKETFKDPVIIVSLNENFISIKVDFDKETTTSSHYGVRGLPDTIFLAENGRIIGRRPGYIPPAIMKYILETILEQRAQD